MKHEAEGGLLEEEIINGTEHCREPLINGIIDRRGDFVSNPKSEK
jgi:hypothetical protein